MLGVFLLPAFTHLGYERYLAFGCIIISTMTLSSIFLYNYINNDVISDLVENYIGNDVMSNFVV